MHRNTPTVRTAFCSISTVVNSNECDGWGLCRGHTERSARYVRFVRYTGKNSCLYGQCNGPHRTAYALFWMLAMLLRFQGV
jgi:hypothetical protein